MSFLFLTTGIKSHFKVENSSFKLCHNITVLMYFGLNKYSLGERKDFFKKKLNILLTPTFWIVVHISL